MSSRVVEFVGGPLDGETRDVVEPLPPLVRTFVSCQALPTGGHYLSHLPIPRDYRLGAIAKPEELGAPWPRAHLHVLPESGRRVWVEPVYMAEEFAGMLPE